MGDARNKTAKVMGKEADKRRMAALSASLGTLPPKLRSSKTLRGDGCGMDGVDHWKPDGSFIRLFSVTADLWDTGKIYCERCLEPHTGVKPNELT